VYDFYVILGVVYTTASPCWNCFKLLANIPVRKIYYSEFYNDKRIFDIAKKCGIELYCISKGKIKRIK